MKKTPLMVRLTSAWNRESRRVANKRRALAAYLLAVRTVYGTQRAYDLCAYLQWTCAYPAKAQ